MANRNRQFRSSLMLLIAACAGVVNAQDARIAVFDRFNHATTYEEIEPILSGVLAQQYAAVASRNPQQLPQILARQQLKSVLPRIVEIDDTNSFLVLESVVSKVSPD